jgi:hypothetical protein
MRSLILTVAFAATSVAATAFPPPLTPEQPVSQRLMGPAAGDQQTLAVASNGQMSFAVWLDGRGGPWQWNLLQDLYGSRIDSAGVSLDPMGIHIASIVSGGTVIWNGTAFVVVSEGTSSGKLFTFITPDGVQAGQKVVPVAEGTGVQTLATSMGSGPEARILFAGRGFATIVDGFGNIVAANVTLPSQLGLFAAASNKSEFLLLFYSSNQHRIDAMRLDRDGKLISTSNTGLDFATVGPNVSLAGGDDNYLLVGFGGRVFAYLDLNGVAQGSLTSLDSSGLPLSTKPVVVLAGDTYLAAWTTMTTDGHAYAAIARVPATEGGTAAPVLTHPLQWSGAGHGAVLGLAGTHVILIVDAFRAGISTTIDPIAKVLDAPFDEVPLPDALSSSLTRQVVPQVASSTNGYAMVWTEYGPDGATHLYLRRFSLTGAPADPAPIEVARDDGGQAITARIAAAGGTYVVVWSTPDTYSTSNCVLRRLSATTGSWIDADPVPLAAHASDLTLGASRDNVLAVYNVACTQGCMRARTIAMDSGPPLRTVETIPTAMTATDFSVASNGTDFLVAWTDNDCFGGPGCDYFQPYSLFVERVGADGTPLDSKPLALDNGNPMFTSIAWAGTSYVVTWTPGYSSINVSRIPANGVLAATQRTSFAMGIDWSPAQRVVSTGSGLLLFTTSQTATVGTTLDAESLVASGTSFIIKTDPRFAQTFSAAALPNGVVVAYDRVGEDTGNVERVFNRVFADTPRRRATR